MIMENKDLYENVVLSVISFDIADIISESNETPGVEN